MQNKEKLVIFTYLFLLFSISISSIFFGSVEWNEFSAETLPLIFEYRVIRVAQIFLAGMSLSLAGFCLQSLLRNPLADPYILGVTSGSALFYIISLSFGVVSFVSQENGFLSSSFQNDFSYRFVLIFIGAIITLSILLLFKRMMSCWQEEEMSFPLLGMMINVFASAVIMCFLYFPNELGREDIVGFLVGGTSEISKTELGFVIGFSLIPLYFLFHSAQYLRSSLFGQEFSEALGFSSQKMFLQVILLASFFVTVSVSLVGAVGFIGILVPHVVKRLHKNYSCYAELIVVALLGGSVLVASDCVARSLIAPYELPIGIFVAVFSIPFFIMMLMKGQKWNANF